MLEDRLNKIIQSVKTSTLLSSQERQEWLTLINLMNDKQLLELEKILTPPAAQPIVQPPVIKPPVVSSPPVQPLKPNVMPPSPSFPKPVHANYQSPSLSHILNIPKTVFPPKPLVAAKPAEPNFLQKLKMALAEKELPPGEVAPPKLAIPAKPSPPPMPSMPKSPVMPVQKPPMPQMPRPLPPLSKINMPPGVVHEPAGQRPPSPKPVVTAFTEQESEMLSDLSLQRAEDLAGLTASFWKRADSNALAKKIKTLIKEFGLPKVLFSLERSPMYKEYLETGTEIISQQLDFDAISSTGGGKKYLSKQEFEAFADLLRRVQSD